MGALAGATAPLTHLDYAYDSLLQHTLEPELLAGMEHPRGIGFREGKLLDPGQATSNCDPCLLALRSQPIISYKKIPRSQCIKGIITFWEQLCQVEKKLNRRPDLNLATHLTPIATILFFVITIWFHDWNADADVT